MIQVTTFYKFIQIAKSELDNLNRDLSTKAGELGIRGLLLLGEEGCNATLSGDPDSIDIFKIFLCGQPQIGELVFKDSYTDKHPFKRFKIDLREEIVTLKDREALPKKTQNNHLSAALWQEALESAEEYVLIDTRNFYETEIGLFKGALDLNLQKFSEFPEKVKQLNIPKEKKVLMYCTGGIRCEKAIIDMQRQGYNNVYQLDGGILKYLEEFPNNNFEGECFVFDHRVAVDQNLNPSKKFKLCPHCGNPADIRISCILCAEHAVVCKRCIVEDSLNTCSKNCAYHAKVRNLSASH